ALEAAEHAWKQIGERFEQLRHDIERPLLPPAELWLSPDALRETLNRFERIEVCGAEHPRHGDAQPLPVQPAPALPLTVKDQPAGKALRDFLSSYPGRVLVAADSAGRREALLEVLQAAGLQPEVLADWSAFAGAPHGAIGLAAGGAGQADQASIGERLGLPSAPGGKAGPHAFAIAVAPFDDGFAL